MLRRLAEAQTLPPVQVFDKTMVVKQMHVLEPQDLLITRADKGKAQARDEEEEEEDDDNDDDARLHHPALRHQRLPKPPRPSALIQSIASLFFFLFLSLNLLLISSSLSVFSFFALLPPLASLFVSPESVLTLSTSTSSAKRIDLWLSSKAADLQKTNPFSFRARA